MALPFSFTGNLTPTGDQLDADTKALGTGNTVQCTATGTNAITLTPVANQPAVAAVGVPNPVRFGWVAANNSTGSVTITVGALPFIKLFTAGGTVQAVSGSVTAGTYYESVYVSSLDGGAGGHVLVSNTPNPTTSIIPSSIGGLALSNDSGTPNTIIDIAAGTCVDSTAAAYMVLGVFTKTTGAWAVGTGNGGLDTGAVGNSTWYHVYVIQRTDTNLVDVLISTNATAPTMPASYTLKRRIGSFKTNGSAQIIAFKQTGNGNQRSYMWATAVTDISAGAISVSPVLTTLASIPPGIKVDTTLNVTLRATATSQNVAVYSADITGGQPSNLIISPSTSTFGAAQARARSNTTQQVFIAGGSATPTIDVTVLGWYDDI